LSHNKVRIVLMADDDEDDCMLAREAFQETGAEGAFSCVEDGMEMLAYLYRTGKYKPISDSPLPVLILLDLNMPRKDGRQALREIKADPVLRDIPVVVLTTSREETDISFSLEMGAQSFVTKPDTFAQWVAIMKEVAKNWLNEESAGGH
jgi:CheY-like chemotaxis protein